MAKVMVDNDSRSNFEIQSRRSKNTPNLLYRIHFLSGIVGRYDSRVIHNR